jgi:hypothetical protein
MSRLDNHWIKVLGNARDKVKRIKHQAVCPDEGKEQVPRV